MARGHGIIVNLSSYSTYIFEYNPVSIESTKKIHYSIAPNIGGAFKKRYFSGFDSKEISLDLHIVDMESPIGVMDDVSFFEQLREPDPGILGGWTLSYGNENFPPPRVLFQFGSGYIPLVWDVLDIGIVTDHFFADEIRGIIGIPKNARINIKLGLVEDNILNKANQIAKKAATYAASAHSIARETAHKGITSRDGRPKRKELPGIFNSPNRRFGS